MRSIKITGSQIIKFSHLWDQVSELKESSHFRYLFSPAYEEIELLCLHNDRICFFLEESAGRFFLHGKYENFNDIQDCFSYIKRPCYMLLNHEEKGTQKFERFQFVKNFQASIVTHSLNDEVSTEEALKLYQAKLPAMFNAVIMANIQKAISEKKYFAKRDEQGRLVYFQMYKLAGDEYYGMFLYSELSASKALQYFYLTHEILQEVRCFSSFVFEENVASQKMHELLGYVKKGANNFLLTHNP